VVFIASVTLKSTNLPITIIHDSQIKPKNTRIFHLTTDSRGFTQIRTNVSEVLNPCPSMVHTQLPNYVTSYVLCPKSYVQSSSHSPV